MIEWWQALLLAMLQGLTEFLPISSSAHLLLPSLLLGWPDQGLAFDVAVHVGTLLAVVGYFRNTLAQLARGVLAELGHRRPGHACHEVLLLGVATAPVVLAGLLANHHMEHLRSLPVVITTTLLFAILLAFADRRGGRGVRAAALGIGGALCIGLAQVLALVPGTSRSGITITAGLLLGLGRESASRFAFLLSIPVIAGAGLLETLDLVGQQRAAPWPLLALAATAAALSAYSCIALFMRFVERVGMLPFVYYRLCLGAVLLIIWWRG